MLNDSYLDLPGLPDAVGKPCEGQHDCGIAAPFLGCVGYALAMIIIFCSLFFCSCGVHRKTSAISYRETENLIERLDSALSNRTVVSNDSLLSERLFYSWQMFQERSDTNHVVVVDTAGRVIKETLVINNTTSATRASESREREVVLQRLLVLDSTVSSMRLQLQHSDSLLQSNSVVVEKSVPASLTWWQKFRLYLANGVLLAVAAYVAFLLWRKRNRFVK